MKILFGGGKSGWVEYVLNGTQTKPRDISKIEIIDGDLELTKSIYESTLYRENYTRGILAFKGKVDNEKMKLVYEEFKELFLTGLEKDEYNISAVLHLDTENNHIHFCLPKLNLKEGIANNYYYDRLDRNRINLIRDYLIEKHHLEVPTQTLALIKEDTLLQRIDKWREDHKQPALNLETKRAKNRSEKKLNAYLKELIDAGFIDSQEELKQTIEALDIKVIKMGYDKPKNFHYFTIEDSKKNKLRIKGEIYGQSFYIPRGKNQRGKTTTSPRSSDNEKRPDKRLGELEALLQKSNTKRREILHRRDSRNKRKIFTNMENIYNSNNFSIRGWNYTNNYESSKTTKFKEHPNKGWSILQSPQGFSHRGRLGQKQLLHKKGVDDDKVNNTTDIALQTRSQNYTGRRESEVTQLINRFIKRVGESRKRLSQVRKSIGDTIKSIQGVIMQVNNEVEKFKKNISLVDFALQSGFTINEKKSCARSAFLQSKSEKIIISKNETNRHYQFFNVRTGIGGSIIDFYSQYIKNIPFKDIVINLRKYYKDGGYKYTLKPSSKNFQEVKREIETLVAINRPNEYLQERKINQRTVDEFQSYIHMDSRDNTAFIHNRFTYNDEKLKIEKVGIERKNKDYKGHSGEKGLWGKKVGTSSNDFYIFESPMDALSFYQLYKKEGNYISTGGNVSNKQLEQIEFLELALKPKNINLCFDGDKGGELLTKRFQESFYMATDRLKREKPKLKDFSDDLIDKLSPKIEGKVIKLDSKTKKKKKIKEIDFMR